ncbi:MAG: lysophospholipid acyltransferase family protein [Bacteroidota bacterium]
MASEWPLRKRIKYKLLYRFVLGLLWLASHFPRKWVLGIYGLLGRLAYRLFPNERKIIAKNLNYALGEEAKAIDKQQFSKTLFRKLAKNVADIFISHSFRSSADLENIIEVEGFEHFEQAYQRGKGVIMLGPHLGAFEMVASYISSHGYKLNIVGRKLKNPTLDKLLVNHRTQFGAKSIYSQEGVLTLVRALKRGEVMAILIDQDVKWAKGIFVNFFGKPTYTPIGAAWLAQSTQAAVVPMAIHRLPNEQHKITVLPEVEIAKTGNTEVDLQTNTQRFSDVLEKLIRMDLTQWVWMHERWKTRPEDVEVMNT